MSYRTIALNVDDAAFQRRVTACCAQERTGDPNQAMTQIIWPICGASDIEAAYASALATENPDPGGDETVITDQMILSAVQALMAPPGG